MHVSSTPKNYHFFLIMVTKLLTAVTFQFHVAHGRIGIILTVAHIVVNRHNPAGSPANELLGRNLLDPYLFNAIVWFSFVADWYSDS